jgi:hypothetical protein
MVKLLPCEQEVMGSPRNTLLQKCRERLHTCKTQSGRTLLHAVLGALHWAALFLYQLKGMQDCWSHSYRAPNSKASTQL